MVAASASAWLRHAIMSFWYKRSWTTWDIRETYDGLERVNNKVAASCSTKNGIKNVDGEWGAVEMNKQPWPQIDNDQKHIDTILADNPTIHDTA